jgi:hypothetical protein
MRLGLRLRGRLDRATLQHALNELVMRHPAFRVLFLESAHISSEERERRLTAFGRTGIWEPGLYSQFVLQHVEAPVREFDLSASDAAAQSEALEVQIRQEYGRRFEYWKPPLIRASLFRLGEAEHVLILVIDHIVCDGFSLPVIKRDLKRLYAYFSGDSNALPEMPRLSFPEFVIWQNRAAACSYFDADVRYWRDRWAQFAGGRMAFHDFPFALPRSHTPNFVFAADQLRFTEADSEFIRAFARRSGVTLFIVFLAAFALALSKYTGKSAVAIWSHLANRTRPGAQDAVGYFINSHILGIDLSADVSGIELLDQARTVLHQALTHQEMPLPYLWRVLRCAPRFSDAMVLMDFMETRRPVAPVMPGLIEIDDFPLRHSPSPRFSALGLYVVDEGNRFLVSAKYATARFPTEAIRELLQNLNTTVLRLAGEPEAKISRLRRAPGRQSSGAMSAVMDEFLLLDSTQIPSVP